MKQLLSLVKMQKLRAKRMKEIKMGAAKKQAKIDACVKI